MINDLKKIRTVFGSVSKAGVNKTVTVKFDRKVKAPLYGKLIKKTVSLIVHDEKSQCCIGDNVEVKETRPFSKLKSWELVRIIK